MSRLWVMACKNGARSDVRVTGLASSAGLVDASVASIRANHPDDDILVVDSDSPDKTYMPRVAKFGAEVLDIGNRQYSQGAHRLAVEQRASYDHYALIADSVWLNAPVPDDVLTVRWFSSRRHPWGVDQHGVDLAEWGVPHLNAMGVPYTGDYLGVLGPYLFCDRDLVDRLGRIGFFDIPVTNKWEQCAMERVGGIVLGHLGEDVTRSLQGEHIHHFDDYDESVVTKINAGRF